MSDLRFLFKLRDVEDIVPWGTPPDLSLSWFGLSDGDYCIETGPGRLLEFREAKTGAVSWCDYQIVRLFEDLSEIAPTVLEPVPEDVVARFIAWEATLANADPPDDDALADAWFGAQEWWGWRQLDFGYLTAAPQLHFWRTGDDVHLRWRAKKWIPEFPLTVARVDETMPVAAFENAVETFLRDFVAAMGRRVLTIERNGWNGQPCAIDIPGLVQEQRIREQEPLLDRRGKREGNWHAVRHHLTLLGA